MISLLIYIQEEEGGMEHGLDAERAWVSGRGWKGGSGEGGARVN